MGRGSGSGGGAGGRSRASGAAVAGATATATATTAAPVAARQNEMPSLKSFRSNPSSEFAGKGWTGHPTDKLSPKQYADGQPKWWARANGDMLDIGEQRGNRPIVLPRHVIESLRSDAPVVITYGVGFNREIRKTFTVKPKG